MSEHQWVLILFLGLFALHFLLERTLSFLNLRHVMAHRDRVPKILEGAISPDNYLKSIEYTRARTKFGHFDAIFGAILTLVYLFSGWIPWLHGWIRSMGLSEMTSGVLLILSFVLIHGIIQLPVDWYQTFHLEGRFGFNRTTVKTFGTDKVKGWSLSFLIGAPFLYGLFWFMTKSGEGWWLWASMFVIGFQLLMVVLYPLVIAPLFNKFSPLQDGDLKQKLEDLARRCRFATQGIFVMDGSKRSTHSNAYFTGFGKARRIVFFDTLIQQLSVAELLAVLAHEIGHYKKKHILKMVFLSSAFTLLGFFILSYVIDWKPFYQAFGISEVSLPVGLLLVGLVAGEFTFWLSPLFNALSRKHEYEADAFAAEQTQDPQSMETSLLKLSEKNLSNLTPHPAYSAYHYSHPTLIERIQALRRVHKAS
jgi:STE24 endopeptidase